MPKIKKNNNRYSKNRRLYRKMRQEAWRISKGDIVENSMEKINTEAVRMIKVENGLDLKDSSQEFKNWAMEKNNFMLLGQKVISLAEQSKILQEYKTLNDDFTSRLRDENFLTDERKIGEKRPISESPRLEISKPKDTRKEKKKTKKQQD
ncbi:hypothetical protein GLOIN_2v1483079 [Rhizophagus irregularis DAOM 181602=DAOM 197198]|uniref:Uncharacterized protein n=2 Tax=Rhizophagus irregularis TaxID=588596 RepID=U9SRY4_RHIID|nr:hypothetical protein GLOIN_2v1483079 [Rhizophagus irregularis DAOM 181602=DAOM 197198]EXX64536.1 hypothetical protein RirG_141770 [Rhizophagus irregularis DAOM 197198w]POG65519.1 hypothetical protein GLOIN_2v1483079 [Rhizophagus irregularis DAOM 181602=DAOM 197198]GBC27943.2 hypothetical protein GLOIN_2v1483079 [Rhizophagus irregularis DAOM 181602=DAOM 197198]|eukprot:XP_025172385.1 hypothetical protein GLOIN_2v1483079 [Rhizophagus irregularis DAOM 181602=DAOM 197198]